MPDRLVTVFGGTGFLGRYVARRLRAHGFQVRVASRHSRRAEATFAGEPGIVAARADVHDPRSVAAALTDAYGVVNAVSLYVERGGDTFDAVHVKAAGRMAELARQAGVQKFVLVSGISASTASPSLYVRKRGEGEAAVQAVFPGAMVVRPAVMFGPEGGIINSILDFIRKSPAFPLFGSGQTRLQPVAVGDVAEAIARILARSEAAPHLYELAGPDVFTYEEFLRTITREARMQRFLVPLPFGAWHVLARVAEATLPRPPFTRNQVELMEVDTVASPDVPGLRDLGIIPQSVEDAVRHLKQNS